MSKSDDTWFEHYNHEWGKYTALEIYINLLASQLSKGSMKRAIRLVATCIKSLPEDFGPEVGTDEGEKIRAGAEESLERVQRILDEAYATHVGYRWVFDRDKRAIEKRPVEKAGHL